MDTNTLQVVELDTGKVVKVIDVHEATGRRLEKIEAGLMMDLDKYGVRRVLSKKN